MKTRIRISIVEPSGLLYGSEFALLDILEHFDTNRFETEVILPKGSPFKAKLNDTKIPFLELLVPPSNGRDFICKATAYARLLRHWRKSPPDVIYVNQGGILRPIVMIARLLQIPVLCQIQTLEDALWVSRLRSTARYVNTYVCNSLYIAKNLSVPSERISVLYYGYKEKNLFSHRRSACGYPMEVGLLGRISETKGHNLVISAARRLKDSNSRKFHFRFIGDAPSPGERLSIKEYVASQGLESLIEFRGYRKDICAELEELDLMVIPSVAEPFGRIYCETAEARLPVLVSDGGGLGELAKKFQVGVVFRAGNVDDFLQKLETIYDNYEAVRVDFDAAAEQMLKSLNIKSYINVIETLMFNTFQRKETSIQWLGET